MILLIPLLMGVVSFSRSILNEQLWTALAKWIRMGLEGKETKFQVSQYLSKQKKYRRNHICIVFYATATDGYDLKAIENIGT